VSGGASVKTTSRVMCATNGGARSWAKVPSSAPRGVPLLVAGAGVGAGGAAAGAEAARQGLVDVNRHVMQRMLNLIP
jgi:hypothetical protein